MAHFEPNIDLRGAVVPAAIAGGVLVAALTEALSPFAGLTFGWLLLAWGTMLAAAGFLLARRLALRGARPFPRLRSLRPGLDLAMVIWIAVVIAWTGVLAVFAVPTTWDSMIYHLARVAHWAQNHSVAFYPTHIIRQLYQPPWAEFAILHLFILAGGDRLANLVQWSSMIATLVGVSVVARQLGVGVRGQVLSVFVCATIPMGILQSATTQNDYAAALWLVCLVHSLLALESRPGPFPAVSAGASLGLALLTKGTTYIFAAPFVVVFLLAGRHRPMSKKLGQGLAIVLCALALNAPQYLRNQALFGSPLGPGGEGSYRYVNEEISLPILASNLLRNLGLHLGTPWDAANAAIKRAIEGMHSAIGIALADPRSTWPSTRFEIIAPVAHEDFAGNGLHLLLIAAAIVVAWSSRGAGRLKAYGGCLIVAFLLFCLLLRWQPWHSRLQLPLFVLGAPVVGVVFERLKPTLLAIVLLMLVVSSWYFLTASPDDDLLVDRQTVFRTTRADQRVAHAGPAYVGATRFVTSSGCLQVGVVLGGNDREYYFFGLLADARWGGKLEPVLIGNESARLAKVRFRPCAIVRVGPASSIAEAGLRLGEQYYRPAWSQGEVQVFVPAPPPVAQSPATAEPRVARHGARGPSAA